MDYKICILRNDRLDTKSSYLKAKKYFADKGINVSFFTKDISELVSVHAEKQVQGFDPRTGNPATLSYMALDAIVKNNLKKYVKEGEYDCVIFSYDVDTLPPRTSTEIVTSWSQREPLFLTTEFIELAINQYDINNDKVWLKISHECVHSFVKTLIRKGINVADEMDMTLDNKPFYKNNDPYDPDGNYAQTLNNIQPHLSKLYRTQGYKWFNPISDPKMVGLKDELMIKLDALREMCGFGLSITSGVRSKALNDILKGSAKNSGHLRGYEVDIACTDSFKRDRIIENSYKVGFTRRGIGDGFVHLGIDPNLPQRVMWEYYK